MRRVIVGMHLSLDGFVGGPDGELGWSYATSDDGVIRWIIESLDDVDTILLGRVAYENMASYWPTATDALATPMNDRKKVVFSRSIRNGAWSNTRVVRGDLVEEVERLKQQPGKDMVVQGGVRFAQSLVQAGLVDQFRLVTHPVALGRGSPLFKDLPGDFYLRLLATREFGAGAVLHVYDALNCPGPRD
jgi:dihydrofolate reductase